MSNSNEKKITSSSPSKNIKPWKFIFSILVNIIIIISISIVYVAYVKDSKQKLFNENIRSVNSLNSASAIAAYTYTNDMQNKMNDIINYIADNNYNLKETKKYLQLSNTNPNRQIQLVLCGTFLTNQEISFGDYSGLSIRKVKKTDDTISTIQRDIIYGSGYYDILRSFTDVKDANGMNNHCFTPEFTDPDTKQKCFATYRHVVLNDSDGKKKLYAILIVVKSETALSAYNIQNKYKEQSTVLINKDGTYIIKNNDYRNSNFYDYIINYNGLTLDKKTELQKKVFDTTNNEDKVTNLFYKNHKGNDCVFSIIRIENGWYSITCVPLSSFYQEDGSINFSLIILLLFVALFVFDGIAVYFVGNAMRYNTMLAEEVTIAANEANQAKSRFLSTMSHELRTPLNAIIGFVSLSKDILGDKEQLKDYLSKINISSKLLLQLISDILDISAIESNKMKLNKGEFNINRLITSLSAIFYDQCSNKNIEFNVVLKNIHSEILIGDAIRVNQILLNFLSNAVKFTPSGGNITFKVDCVKREDDSVVIRFAIIDTGCGISDELKSRLFKPFERAIGDKAHKYSGTGLGLSIAKNITELMGGEVGVESVEGMGSTFWAEIPFVSPEKIKTPYYSPIKGLRIIVAIHNADEREFFGQMLTNFGVVYSLVDKAEKVFNLLEQKKGDKDAFNLCILDWKMSDLNAQDTTLKLRENYSKEELKIVVFAYDLTIAKPLCMEVGADYVIRKPVFSSSLYNFLQEVTSNKVQSIAEESKKYDLDGKRVLLVEDNTLNIEVAQQMLQKFNLYVEVAMNGRQGYEMFLNSETNYYNGILMDVQMPIMNGYEATKAIRGSSHKDAKTVPILAMTADAFSEDVEKAKQSGMNEHISKPIEPDILYNVLKKYL